MELPIIENAYTVINQIAPSTFLGLPIVLATGIISVLITLFTFGLNQCAQYYTTRRRELKRLDSIKYTLSIVNEELTTLVTNQVKSLIIYVRDMKAIQNFSSPSFTTEPDKKSLMDTVDKKESMYLISRWTNDSQDKMKQFLELIRISENISAEVENMRKVQDSAVLPQLFKLKEQWDNHFLIIMYASEELPANRSKYDLSLNHAMAITKPVSDYLLRGGLLGGNLVIEVLEIDAFHKIVVEAINNNPDISAKAMSSTNVEFKKLYNSLKVLNQVYIEFNGWKITHSKFYESYQLSMAGYAIKLPKIKKAIDDITYVELCELA